jgi:myosin-5
MWEHISFPDNQDVLILIDAKHTGILALLDEQCILPKSTDEKFTRCFHARCDSHPRFSATSAQRVDCVFSIKLHAGLVEHTTDSWLEKNKEQQFRVCRAAVTIQCAWHLFVSRMCVFELMLAGRTAAMMI